MSKKIMLCHFKNKVQYHYFIKVFLCFWPECVWGHISSALVVCTFGWREMNTAFPETADRLHLLLIYKRCSKRKEKCKSGEITADIYVFVSFAVSEDAYALVLDHPVGLVFVEMNCLLQNIERLILDLERKKRAMSVPSRNTPSIQLARSRTYIVS